MNISINKDKNKDELLQELLNYKERFSIALKASKICVFEVDLVNQLYTFFENSEDIFGVPGAKILEEVKAYSFLSPQEYQKAVANYFSHPEDASVINNAFTCILRGESTSYNARMKAGDTEYIWCKLDVTPILKNGIPVHMIGVITDISKMKAKADELEQKACLDSFTGLYNKNTSEKLISRILHHFSHQNHALVLIDIDHFKKINDTFGHVEGDRVLLSVSHHLKKVFRKTDVIGRFGGDEFLVLIRDIPDRDFLHVKLHQLLQYEDSCHHITMSVGISLYPEQSTSFHDLFDMADKALYISKKSNNTFTIY